MSDMADLFFAYGGHNYARYLAWFSVFLQNIEATHPGATELLQRGVISVARSNIPGNLCATDKTMEETFMRFYKSKSGANPVGLTGLLTNYKAYQRWIRTTSERALFYQGLLDMCGLTQSESDSNTQKHRETSQREIDKNEKAIQRVLSAFKGFLNPFDIDDKDHLYVISSGKQVPPEIERDVLRAETA